MKAEHGLLASQVFAQEFVVIEKEEDRLLAWQVFAQVFVEKEENGLLASQVFLEKADHGLLASQVTVCAGVCREGRR